MCLARPGKVVKIKEDSVTLDYGKEEREAGTSYLKPNLGDHVLVSGGQVIQKIDEKDLR